METCAEPGVAVPHVGPRVHVHEALDVQGDALLPDQGVVVLVVGAVEQNPGSGAAGDEVVQVVPDDDVPAPELVVEPVVGGGRLLVRADGGEDGLLQAVV